MVDTVCVAMVWYLAKLNPLCRPKSGSKVLILQHPVLFACTSMQNVGDIQSCGKVRFTQWRLFVSDNSNIPHRAIPYEMFCGG